MYRAVTFAALRRGIDPADPEPVAAGPDGRARVTVDTVRVDGVDATIEIRGPEVSRAVSLVAANADVRTELVRRQRSGPTSGGGVLEGRDIGSVVFPDAVLKVPETPAPRCGPNAGRPRSATSTTRPWPPTWLGATRSTRSRDRPAPRADGALELDTSDMTVDEIVDELAGGSATMTDHEAGATPADTEQTPGPRPTPTGRPTRRRPPVVPPRSSRRCGCRRRRPSRRRSSSASYAIVRGAFLGLAKAYFRLEIHGAEHVPAHGPFVLAPIHRSNLDFILVATVRRPRMRYMGKASIWKSKALGRFVSMLGAFPVHRGTADRESLRTCIEVIENGEPLVMFPEGTRRSGDTVEDLFDGTAYVAAQAGVPLVPVGIGGSDEAMPVGAKFIKPHKIVLVVGPPIHPPAGDGTGRVKRRVVRELTAQLRPRSSASTTRPAPGGLTGRRRPGSGGIGRGRISRAA